MAKHPTSLAGGSSDITLYLSPTFLGQTSHPSSPWRNYIPFALVPNPIYHPFSPHTLLRWHPETCSYVVFPFLPMTKVCPSHSSIVFQHRSLPLASDLIPCLSWSILMGFFHHSFLPSPHPPASLLTLLRCLPAHLFLQWPIFDAVSFFLFLPCLSPLLRPVLLCSHLIQVCPGNLILFTALIIVFFYPLGFQKQPGCCL